MSSEDVRQFIRKAQDNPALKTQLEGVPQGVAGERIEAIVKIANAAGFAFTAKDYTRAVNELLEQKHAAGELNDEELRLVAGGLRPVCTPSCGMSAVCGATR
jgi:predicted ribosomally synthesized peptide with nif11-like leader